MNADLKVKKGSSGGNGYQEKYNPLPYQTLSTLTDGDKFDQSEETSTPVRRRNPAEKLATKPTKPFEIKPTNADTIFQIGQNRTSKIVEGDDS